MRPCEHFKKKIDSHSHLNPQDLTLNSQNKLSRTESRLENQVLSFKTKVLSQEIKWTNCHLTNLWSYDQIHHGTHHFLSWSTHIILLSFVMKQNLHFQNASSHKEPVKRPTKFPAHSVLLKQKCKTFGCRPQSKNNFSKIQQTKPFAGPFLLPKNFN